MPEFAVRFQNVSKRYGMGRSRTFTMLFSAWIGKLRGLPEPPRRHWAVENVSFEVPPGESLGIVGSNGSGKTTVLKMLSRVTWPTQGRIQIAGRVISLIELGAGFHPELTGRENIYLHGSILGLPREEVTRNLDDIVEFAGIEKFLDTPVKWFSSGMYARLGFSVAAYSRPDVLLVDEVLAVGDAAFQRRAIDRMQAFVREGKTVLFVSHDLDNVRGLCRRVLWLEKGVVRAVGETETVVAQYLDDVNARAVEQQQARDRKQLRPGSGEVRFTDWHLGGADAGGVATLEPGDPLCVTARYHAFQRVRRPRFRFLVVAPRHQVVVGTAELHVDEVGEWLEAGDGEVECRFESLPLGPGQYRVQLAIAGDDLVGLYDQVTVGPQFVIAAGPRNGLVSVEHLVELSSTVRLQPREPR